MGLGLQNKLDQPLPVDYQLPNGQGVVRIVIPPRGLVDLTDVSWDALSENVRLVMVPRGWLKRRDPDTSSLFRSLRGPVRSLADNTPVLNLIDGTPVEEIA